MQRLILTVCVLVLIQNAYSQELYFPPLDGDEWETTNLEELGWCTEEVDSLLQFLDEENTRAFLVIKDGKIVIEQYYENHGINTWWYWASAGKSLTAFLTGLAQEQGYLDISEPASNYLGEGWTSTLPEQEESITIWNQLTMTSGLDDSYQNSDCTNDSCLYYLAEPGTRWAYHNAPYTLLESVVSNATGEGYNAWTNTEIEEKTGMVGAWIQLDYNNVYWSSARSMARFGLLMLNNGVWDTDTIMHDQEYLNDMIIPSQDLNNAYGYLWWLNSGPDYMIPGLQFVFNGNISPNAPLEMYAAAGKNGQLLNIVPSENLIVVRMGDNPNNSLVPITFQNQMWDYLNDVMCEPTTVQEPENRLFQLYPNPSNDFIQIELSRPSQDHVVHVLDITGRILCTYVGISELDISHLRSGNYFLCLNQDGIIRTKRFIKY